MEKFKMGIIGLGGRGTSLMKDTILDCGKADVTIVCDVYEDRTEEAAKIVYEKTGKRPEQTKDYQKVLDKNKVDCVLITTSWQTHIPIAIDVVRAGIPLALEVGNAYSVQQCWDLVRAWEETKSPFMFMENCNFGRYEMMALNMKNLGVFGEIIHCAGGYHHWLAEEICFGRENRHYRLDNYLKRNCENYPTHELGPIARMLDINYGNRMMTLSSVASKSVALNDYVSVKKSDDEVLKNSRFNQGDVVTTTIKCANGETIVLTLDTNAPGFYNRGFTVIGTKARYDEISNSLFLANDEDLKKEFDWRKTELNNVDTKYIEKYEHPVWKKYQEDGVQGTHDGMDWLEFNEFFDRLAEGKDHSIDVYDAASWMAIGCLSEQSIAMGGAPVAIPDFTDGKWMTRKANY